MNSSPSNPKNGKRGDFIHFVKPNQTKHKQTSKVNIPDGNPEKHSQHDSKPNPNGLLKLLQHSQETCISRRQGWFNTCKPIIHFINRRQEENQVTDYPNKHNL